MKTIPKNRILLCFFAFWISLSLFGCANGEKDFSVQTRALTYGVGARLPEAADFFIDLPDGYTARYAEEYDFHTLGDYTLTVIVSNSHGLEKEYDVMFSLVHDTEPPVMTGVQDISVYKGDGISYRNGVSLSDNCDGEVTLTVDSSRVDLDTEGSYPVVYTATDAAGNQTVLEIRVYVYRAAVTEEMLYELVDPIIAEKQMATLSKEAQVRAIYQYVYYFIDYTAYSDKSDWVRAAYEGLRTGKGDCYTYFALSKAFFERLNLENMDIVRTTGIVEERHYWNYVNIGSEDSPSWYHFDACQIRGVQHSGCLLTDKQVAAYTRQRVDENGVGNYFYAYDNTKYPASSEKIITATPSLEPYY